MRDKPLLQEALDLTRDIYGVNIGIDFNYARKEKWRLVAYYYLCQSCKTLVAIHCILRSQSAKELLTPVDILVRSLFEFAVRLKYMEANPGEVADFLTHHERLPKRPWKNIGKLAKKVGLEGHWDKVYELTSQKAHGGAQGLSLEYLRLLGIKRIPDWEPANALATAVHYYRIVVDVNTEVFPPLKSNFANFQPGTDWDNRLAVLWGRIKEDHVASLQEDILDAQEEAEQIKANPTATALDIEEAEARCTRLQKALDEFLANTR